MKNHLASFLLILTTFLYSANADDPYPLWTGDPIPADPAKIPFAKNIEHRIIHAPGEKDDKFLHGAALIHHDGVFYANWANSPTNENGPHERLRGRRSTDEGKTWSPIETVGPGFQGEDRHSHGVLFVHQNEVWTICARFGVGDKGKKFNGLKAEAFVLDKKQTNGNPEASSLKIAGPSMSQ